MSNAKTMDEVLEVTAQILIRCTVMGVIVLLVWWGALTCCGEFAYKVHSEFFPMSREQFGVIHYVGILATKAAVSLLFFIPYIAIRLVIKKRQNQSRNQPSGGAAEPHASATSAT